MGREAEGDRMTSRCEWFAHRMREYRSAGAPPAEASQRRHFGCSSPGRDSRAMALESSYSVAAGAELVNSAAAAHPLL